MDIGYKIVGYCLTVGVTRGIQVGIDIGKESDEYRLTVG